MKTNVTRVSLAGFAFVAIAMLTEESAHADCSTCSVPTVAYQPVVVQPTTIYQPVATTPSTSWYPGKLFDQMRLRRYGVATPVAPTYAPSTASYAPYTASYPTHTAGYAPYVRAYAPLRRTLVARPLLQTAYYPGVVANPCSSCVQTVARPVVLSPVLHSGCSTCATPACSACSTVPTGVNQASFVQPGCSSCATSAAVPSYSPTPALAPNPQGSTVGPPTPQPQLSPNEAAPSQSNYPDPQHQHDPQPLEDLDTSTSFEAPRLLDPRDRTARHRSSSSPTVDVWNAVYHKSSADQIDQTPIHQTSGRPARTQAEIDAEGWQSVPRSR